MIIPISDRPNYSTSRPWANYTLVGLNVLVFLWAHAVSDGPGGYEAFIQHWGFVPAAPRIETYFTSMFMHSGFLHIGGNMLFLWIFGDNVEARLGHVGYLCTYLASGLAAVLLFQLLSPGSFVPLVGASGAIFGVTGFYFVAFPQNRVRVLIFLFLIFFYDLKARWVLGFYFVVDFVNMLMHRQDSGGGVAYAAHVGGFAFGFALAALMLRLLPPAHPTPPRTFRTQRPAPERLLKTGLAHARAGRVNRAYEAFEGVVQAAPGTEAAGFAALQMAIIRGRILGDFPGARGLLDYALQHLQQPAHIQRARAELSEITG